MSKAQAVGKWSILVCGVALLAGCETSDDPREGGLFGYWATGDQGYQRRLDDRRYHLGSLEAENAHEQARTQELKSKKSSLAREHNELTALKRKLDAAAADLQGKPEGANLLGQIQEKKAEIGALQQKDNSAELEGEVARLRNEVNELKRKADLMLKAN